MEDFLRQIDWARFWPWLHNLDLFLLLPVLAIIFNLYIFALFLLIPMLAHLSTLCNLLFPAVDFIQLFLYNLTVLSLFLERIPKRCAELNSSSRIAGFLTFIQAHA